MRKLLYLFIMLPICAYAQNPVTVGDVAHSKHLAMGAPGTNIPGVTLIARRGYACLHSSDYKDPLWSSYYITKENFKTSVPRNDAFQPDPNLFPGFRAELADYAGNGGKRTRFDRGHMAPCEDMSRDAKTQMESFYLSNMVPQDWKNNEVFWKHLEARFRQYVNSYGSMYIITGPIFRKPLANGKSPVAAIGDDHVAVPVGLFKIAVRQLPSGTTLYVLIHATHTAKTAHAAQGS